MKSASLVIPRMLALFLFLFGTAAVAAERYEALRGQAFSEPGKTVKKTEKWIKQPIRYGKWGRDADVALTLDQRQYHILLPIIQQYAKEKNVAVAVNEGTCGHSEGMLRAKKVDIGGWCCPPADYDRLPGLIFNTVGIGALAIVVHADNPVDSLTMVQVRGIFRGDITNWSQIEYAPGKRGRDLPIRSMARLHCKLRPGAWHLILANEDLFTTSLTEVGTPPDQLIAAIGGYPGAIGHEAVWNIERFRDKGHTKAVKIDGYSPWDMEALISGNYPLYRVYNLSTWEQDALVNATAQQLVHHVIRQVAADDLSNPFFWMAPAQRLREAGWKFRGSELIGEPR